MTGSDLRPWPQARLQCTNFYDPGSSERLEYLQSSTGSSSWASHLIYKESRSEIQAVDFWLLYCLDLTLDLAVCLKLNLFVKINSVYYWLSSCQHYFFWTSYWSLTIYQTSIFWSYQLSDLAVLCSKRPNIYRKISSFAFPSIIWRRDPFWRSTVRYLRFF